eukprot:2414676-Rhodomonas_salina.1
MSGGSCSQLAGVQVRTSPWPQLLVVVLTLMMVSLQPGFVEQVASAYLLGVAMVQIPRRLSRT